MSTLDLFLKHYRGADASEILADVTSNILAVEQELETMVQSSVPVVQEVGRLTLRAGGKRLRPAFVALAAKSLSSNLDPQRLSRLGACLELVHMATLIHDDVIDETDLRRGLPTAARSFGNTISILSGDVMLARSMTILAEDGDLDIIRTVARSVVEMAEGEAREVASRGNFDLSEADHLEILRMKTASFVECCCHVGAQVAQATPQDVDALSTYGHHVGMAFQIIDDLLDYQQPPEVTGKPQATDFREACATLPLIYLREMLSADERAFVSREFGNGVSDDEIRMITSWMDQRGAFARALGKAQAHAESAREALLRLPESEHRHLLEAVIGFVLDRQA
ncbi:MAG TPA: polyprenyl synthetase family protein [Fimbriimonadaceae bacterium]|nr:polyprenyl synthetase family protein [Fimbriimonadaceae bacterium]HRJ32756.1 polyprenyl synthetase family protein [Fimbriimonadaceae bacterium]